MGLVMFFAADHWQWTPIIIPVLVAAFTALIVAGLAWHRYPAQGAVLYGLAMLAVSQWSFGYALELASADLAQAEFWAKAQYLGIVVLPVCWLAFAMVYTGHRAWLRPHRLAPLLALPVLTLVSVATNQFHGLMWDRVHLDTTGPFAVLDIHRGPWFWVHTAYSYALLLAGSVLLLRMFLRSSRPYAGQVKALLAALAAPWLGSALYLGGFQPLPHLDLTTFAFTFSGVVMLWGLFRLRLLEIVPIARAAVIEGMSDGMMVLDAQGRVADLNPTGARMLGLPAASLIGRLPAAALSDQSEWVKNFRARDGEQAEITIEESCYDLRVSALSDGKGRSTGRVITARDITAARQAEAALRRSQDQLREAQKMEAIGRLAGGIAHDFNNLLTIINGYSEFLAAALDPDSRMAEDARAIRAAGERAAELTRQLLAFGRRQMLEIRAFDLNEAMGDLARMLGRVLGERVTVELDLADDLGWVEADRGQIEQVVLNLALNARDAMPDGGTLTLRTFNPPAGAAESGAQVAFEVSDTGYGMDPEVLEHLFEPFFTTKAWGKGTGLGLAMVHGIVTQSRGEVQVRSRPGQGTTFTVYLPRSAPDRAPASPVAAPATSPMGTESVLVVEDEEGVRALAITALRRLGYQVSGASNGLEALAAFGNGDKPVHLVLTDVVMPGMGGPEFVRRLRERRQGFGVLYMTGYAQEAAGDPGPAELDAPVIGKPFDLALLATRVREVLDAREPESLTQRR